MKKIAISGISHRAIRLLREMDDETKKNSQLVGLFDVDDTRFKAISEVLPEYSGVPTFIGENAYAQMLEQTNPDLLWVTTRDSFHAEYTIAALQRNIDVLVEKPMTVTAAESAKVVMAEKSSKARVYVGYNYRYQAINIKIKELLKENKVGKVTAVEFLSYKEENHGSSFFRRWNRMRENSGGVPNCKEGHYFDLVNWWLDDYAEEVFAYTGLKYYGPEGETNPRKVDGRMCHSCPDIANCPYENNRKGTSDAHVNSLRGKHAEYYKDYRPDMCIYDSEINTEDTFSAVFKYHNGVFLTYSANYSSPFSCHRVVINGTQGRLELGNGFSSKGHNLIDLALVFRPLFSNEDEIIKVKHYPGGHDGGDPRLLRDIIIGDVYEEALADSRDGAMSVSMGEGIWRSGKEHRPIKLSYELYNSGNKYVNI